MTQFKTQYNQRDVYDGNKFEKKSFLPHMTIPSQSMTIREIMERQARGLSITDGKVPIYDGEEYDLPDLKTMDLSEIEDYKNSVQTELAGIKKKHENFLASKKKKATPKEEPKKDDEIGLSTNTP